MYKIMLIAVAGSLGTLARYWLSGWADQWWGGTFPAGTLIVNALGCLAIGFLFHATEEKYLIDPAARAAVLVGFLGGFTTFSAFAFENVELILDKNYGTFALYSFATFALCLLAALAGLMITRS